MIDFNPKDEKQLDLYTRAMASFKELWEAELALHRCVRCARNEIAEWLEGSAGAARWEIIVDWANENSVKENPLPDDTEAPMERNGIFRQCKYCCSQ
jgi:hypothetical protein